MTTREALRASFRGRDDSLLGGLFGDRCVDQFDGFHVAPIVVLGGEVDADDVTREADTALAAPLVHVHVHVVFPLRRCGLAAQDVGDATRRVVFFSVIISSGPRLIVPR